MRRIVLDTNCLLMALPSRSPYHRVWTDFLSGTLEFCVSTVLALKIARYFQKPLEVIFQLEEDYQAMKPYIDIAE